jgi:hypothetical protein
MRVFLNVWFFICAVVAIWTGVYPLTGENIGFALMALFAINFLGGNS